MKSAALALVITVVLLELPMFCGPRSAASALWELRAWVAPAALAQWLVTRWIARRVMELAMRVPAARVDAGESQ